MSAMTELCMIGADKLFELCFAWGIKCVNCRYREKCDRHMSDGDFCSDFFYRDDDACEKPISVLEKSVEQAALQQ